MPVLDHEVHELVKVVGDFRYTACQNKVRQPGYFALQRHYFPDGRFELRNKWIEDRMSEDCRYSMSLTDEGCIGCAQGGKGEAYDLGVREKVLEQQEKKSPEFRG